LRSLEASFGANGCRQTNKRVPPESLEVRAYRVPPESLEVRAYRVPPESLEVRANVCRQTVRFRRSTAPDDRSQQAGAARRFVSERKPNHETTL
jgi:hypothetical protein